MSDEHPPDLHSPAVVPILIQPGDSDQMGTDVSPAPHVPSGDMNRNRFPNPEILSDRIGWSIVVDKPSLKIDWSLDDESIRGIFFPGEDSPSRPRNRPGRIP